MRLFAIEKIKINKNVTTVNVLLLLFSALFHLHFTSNFVVFVWGSARIFLAPSPKYPRYATGSRNWSKNSRTLFQRSYAFYV